MPTATRTTKRTTSAAHDHVITIRVSLTPGICRWCRCTYERPCANGCGWADRAQTLCSECVSLDTAMATAKGRRELAESVQEYGFLEMPAKPRRRR